MYVVYVDPKIENAVDYPREFLVNKTTEAEAIAAVQPKLPGLPLVAHGPVNFDDSGALDITQQWRPL